MQEAGVHLDLDSLVELKTVMGADFGLLIETFVSDSNNRLNTLKTALQQQDAEALRRTAHSFKGSASNMCAPRLTSLCRMLEEQGGCGELSQSGDVLAQLEQEYLSVVQLMRAQ